MAVISEEALRKIISQKINKENSLDEIGFRGMDLSRGVDFGSRLKCDLSNLKRSNAFTAWFAKHFIFNPLIKMNRFGGIEDVNRGNIATAILGFHMSDAEIANYTQQVNSELRSNPQILDSWISAFEFLLEVTFFPTGYVFCELINKHFLSQLPAASNSSSAMTNSQSQENIKRDFEHALNNAGLELVRGNNINASAEFRPPMRIILYPKTSIDFSSNITQGLRQRFESENRSLENIINTTPTTPGRIYNDLESHIPRVRRKSEAMTHLKHVLNDSQIINDDQAGEAVRAYLSGLKDAAYSAIDPLIT